MSIFGQSVVGRPGDTPDIELNQTFASVAADLRYIPGGHYSLAECQPYASRRRDSKGRFTKKEQS